jgi:hypothetical protein
MSTFIHQMWIALSKMLTSSTPPRVQGLLLETMLRDTIHHIFQPAVYGTLAQIAQLSDDTPAHVYIVFRTDVPDIRLPSHLRLQYPEELSIVLQHQFFDLSVQEASFSVTLSFNQKNERITVPWSAITRFRDVIAQWDVQRPAPNPTPPSSPPPGARRDPERPANLNVVHVDFTARKRDPSPK